MDLTVTELATVPGAAIAIGLIIEAAKTLGMPSHWARPVAILGGIAIVDVFTALSAQASGAEWVGVIFVASLAGISAGFTAITGYDKLTSGFDYNVARSGE